MLRLVRVITPLLSWTVGEDEIDESPLILTENPGPKVSDEGYVISIEPVEVKESARLNDKVYDASVLI